MYYIMQQVNIVKFCPFVCVNFCAIIVPLADTTKAVLVFVGWLVVGWLVGWLVAVLVLVLVLCFVGVGVVLIVLVPWLVGWLVAVPNWKHPILGRH